MTTAERERYDQARKGFGIVRYAVTRARPKPDPSAAYIASPGIYPAGAPTLSWTLCFTCISRIIGRGGDCQRHVHMQVMCDNAGQSAVKARAARAKLRTS